MRSLFKFVFVSFMAVATLNTAVSVCYASLCPMAIEKKGCCCHENSLSQPDETSRIKRGSCCAISQAPATNTAFLKSEGVPAQALSPVVTFSQTPRLKSAPLSPMAHLLAPLLQRPQKTVLRI